MATLLKFSVYCTSILCCFLKTVIWIISRIVRIETFNTLLGALSSAVHCKPRDLNAGSETVEDTDREKIALVPG